MQYSNGERTKRRYFHRNHAAINQKLVDDYFSNQPTYDEAIFRHRFWMQKHLFLHIVGDLSKNINNNNNNHYTKINNINKKCGIYESKFESQIWCSFIM
jgi:hypothetical protein